MTSFQLPNIKNFERTLQQQKYEPKKLLLYLQYLMDHKQLSLENEPVHIYKTIKKIIIEKACMDSLKGVATFLMGMVMIGHIHIYQNFNQFILPTIVSVYVEHESLLKAQSPLRSSIHQGKDSIFERIGYDKKYKQQWLANFSGQLLILLAKWLPDNFYQPHTNSIYLKIIREKKIKETMSQESVVYDAVLLKEIQAFIEELNLGGEDYCQFCWKYQLINQSIKTQNSQKMTTKASLTIQNYRTKKSARQNRYRQKLNNFTREFNDDSQNQSNQSRPIHDKFSILCYFSCPEFYALNQDKQILFKQYLFKKGTQLKDLHQVQFQEKIHKGILKLKYHGDNATLLQPKTSLKKHNKKDKYFLIDFQERVRKIVIEFPHKKILYPLGYLKLLENYHSSQWEAAKNKLRTQSFAIDEKTCSLDQIALHLNLKASKNVFTKQKCYESFFKVCKKIIKLSMKMQGQEIQVQGWCDENIESIIILDEILSQIKFCFGIQ